MNIDFLGFGAFTPRFYMACPQYLGFVNAGDKSALGDPSTLVNASRQTNFMFELKGEMTDQLVAEVNDNSSKARGHRICDRYRELLSKNISLVYINEDSTVENNLCLIDSRMPEIVGEMLKLHYVENISKISEQVQIFRERNPLNYNGSGDYPYYEYKIKKLLVSYALGMQSGTPWNGIEHADGGYTIVRQDGEVLCYNLYNRNDFEDYLIRHTKLETPSTTRNACLKVFKTVDGRYLVNFNLQIRFF
jgi:hypothetical protein